MDEKENVDPRIRELQVELEETKSLSTARSILLEQNIKELNEVYRVLSEKLKELRGKDEKIRSIEEELIRVNRLSSLGELAASIAHEIKNPLISIQGFAKRIEKTCDMEKIKRYARLIDKESGRLSDVLKKLLAYSRMDGPKKEKIDVNEIVKDTVLFMEHHLTRFKNIQLIVDMANGLPYVEVDKVHIQQALVNIIMNAAQAMPNGGTIQIKTKMENGMVSVSVTDEGVGIKKEDLNRIFEPFFTTKKVSEGTGLGLSLCKKLVEANNGRIEVESTVGKGSTFRILLPPTG